eukprot:GHUV01014364.1.p1 GENE.GHUV01014364.1~~GHUV01014364.1.p1  ORF type:complete len:233 (+),score=45.29 GHUV01014364.1:337-1035(+)
MLRAAPRAGRTVRILAHPVEQLHPTVRAAHSRTANSSSAWPGLRVAVVGCGVGGPVLAMMLKKYLGCTPVVFERVYDIKEVGAGISLAHNGLRVLDSLGLAQKIQNEVGEVAHFTEVLKPNGKRIVHVPTAARFDEGRGLCMTGIRRYRLLNALLEHMRQMDIPLKLGKQLADIQQDTSKAGSASGKQVATLLFRDGSSYEADLVVGCDGLRSTTRTVIKGKDEPPPRLATS